LGEFERCEVGGGFIAGRKEKSKGNEKALKRQEEREHGRRKAVWK
jgi:hypothetical protein